MIQDAFHEGFWEAQPLLDSITLSPRAKQLLGYEAEEITNSGAVFLSLIHPEDREIVVGEIKAVRAGRQDRYNMEFRMRCKDGSYKQLLARGKARFDETGACVASVGYFTDLTRLEEAEKRYEKVTDLMDDVVSLHDNQLRTIYATSALTRLTGYTHDEIIGKSVLDRAHPLDRPHMIRMMRRLRRDGEALVRWRHRTRVGAWRWFETKVRTLKDTSWHPACYLCSTRDISDRIETEQRVHWQAEHDTLTELPNRAFFLKAIEQELQRLRTEKMLAILFIDLDGFKRINDTLGHPVGDALLKVVAGRLIDAVRARDIVGRMGGDEFTILLDHIESLAEVERIVQRLLASIAQPIHLAGQDLFVAGSIGIALAPRDGNDAETLLRHADLAMYHAKEFGNCYRVFDSSMHDVARERLRHEHLLRRALENDEFEMHYQPQVNPATGEVLALEALLRWTPHEGDAPISPARFIAIAEESGLIEPLGSWILQAVCRQGVLWQRQCGSCPMLAVNVSALQITQPWFYTKVERVLEQTGFPASLLELELTESAFLGRAGETARQTLDKLRALGVTLAVDDFGTGYSSLSYLRDLPLDALKIDASFLRDLPKAPQTQAILRAIVELSHALNLEVVAEGVENEAQRALLTTLQCDRIQGYLIARALPPQKVLAFLESHAKKQKAKAA